MTIRKGSGTMTSALQLQPEIITLEQYEALPESRRAEVFEGVIYDMASCQTSPLQSSSLTLWLFVTRINWLESVVTAPRILSLRLFPRRIRQMIISEKRITTKLTVSANTGSWIRSAVWSRSTISRENLSMWHTALMPLSR